jgi:hypothetical protein
MTLFVVVCVAGFLPVLIWALRLRRNLAQTTERLATLEHDSAKDREASAAERKQLNEDLARARSEAEQERARLRAETEARLKELEADFARDSQSFTDEVARVRAHYERELRTVLTELEPLRRFQPIANAEQEAQRVLGDGVRLADELRRQAQLFADASRIRTETEVSEAASRVRELKKQADTVLARATEDARRIVDEAHKRAEAIAGDAYVALREKESLEQSIRAIRNVVDGYGDRYVVPTRSLLDELSADFGHLEAGENLRRAREQSRRMVEEGHAAECDYAEAKRRETAIRFVIDAFNGRVDGILSRTRHDNFGTLEQEIRDAFGLVNLNGEAFRNARILPAFLDARLEELKWGVVAQELRLKEREEQRRIQEQIREEEKARREAERVMRETQREEEVLQKAIEKARAEVESASAEERARFEQRVQELNQKLAEAEAKNQRAKSMAEQTRAGNVYVISNIGSFGEDVVKIGMTRRMDPMDRIYELGDASVPFEFDVHAMITTDDAPSLERELHERFETRRVNRVNFRKEFFRVAIHELRDFVAAKGLQATFTMAAEAREFRESQAIAQREPTGPAPA